MLDDAIGPGFAAGMKPAAGLWPVRCAPIGSVAVGSLLWRHGGRLHCTALVKATFGLVPRGPMSQINPSPLRRSDDYLHGVPSLAGGSEIAPRMDQVDVTIVGHAYAHPPTTKRAIRFVLVRGHQVLIDKTLYVYGDRKRGEAPKLFDRIRVGYERALGGLNFPKNPVGVGGDADSTQRPNIVHPKGPKKKIAGFGPYPARFLQRRQLRGDVSLERITDGIADYPTDFDWRYFQAAPRDQRIDRLKGDEWLMLEGMHRDHERVRARLPHARGLCRVYAGRDVGAPEMVDLRATMLHIEPDDDRCSVVWRGSFPIASELAAQQLIFAGAIQCGDEVVRWPGSITELESLASPAAPISQIEGSQADDLQRTVASPGASEHQRQQGLGSGYRLGEQKIRLAAAAPADPSEPTPGQAVDAAGEQAAQRAAQHAAQAPPPVPPARVPPPPSFSGHDSGTYGAVPAPSTVSSSANNASAPFPLAPSATAQSDPAVTRPLGTPGQRAEAASPQRAGEDLSSTDELEDPEGDAAADAGLAPSVPAETRHLAVHDNPFESTQLIEEPEAEAIDDVTDNPFAFTQVELEVDDD